MGIPRLISTLEPYVFHGILDNESIVIDGPALAYHVLYICNRHGIPQPPYNVLGETTIAWLDALVERGVNMYVDVLAKLSSRYSLTPKPERPYTSMDIFLQTKNQFVCTGWSKA